MFVEVLDAKRSPDNNSLIVTLRMKKLWDQSVKFGELTVDAFRFLNPELLRVVSEYSQTLLETKALLAPPGLIAAGETETLTITVTNYRRVCSLSQP
jgi:hypothetical protein